MSEPVGFFGKVRDFLERLLALKVTEGERRYANDPSNIFGDEISGRRPTQVALVLALLFHILILVVTLPAWGPSMAQVTREVFVIQPLARPAQLAGSEGAPAAAPPKPKPVAPKPKPKLVPIPDPTPDAPEPIKKKELEEEPPIVQELALDLSIGDVTAPPGPPAIGGRGKGRQGEGLSNRGGRGTGTSDGGGIYRVGGGVTNPQILIKTNPRFTDEAIKAKVQGVVLLQAVIRKNGRADNFKVIRGLGFGLEESAIREIASNWKFKPGTKNGRPVDVLATIEVSFNLR